jgi:subtilisin family serine protease
MVWEATFYENAPTRVDIQIGVNARAQYYDTRFSGTSSACPTATGLIATALETNRTWTWQNIRTWLQSLTEQSASTFYQGPDPATATSADWANLNSLMGGTRRVGYNNITSTVTVTVSGSGLTMGGSGLTIKF